MTKEQYFEMCEMIGSEPVESEIPKELSDFPYLVIQAWHVYNRLQARMDGFSGVYLGKDLSLVPVILDLMGETEDRLLLYDIVDLINSVETEEFNKRVKSKVSTNTKT